MRQIFTFLLLSLSVVCYSQTRTITGTIKDASGGAAIRGVSVLEKGTSNGTISNTDGTYSIPVRINSSLVFTYQGYNMQEVKVNNNAPINILLSPTFNMLNEVVVTALGIQRDKRELGYAVQTIRSKDITEVRQTNLVNALAGRVAGVQVTNGSSGVGSSSRIVIRGENSLTGNNQPLFVVDGVPITNNVITNNTENNETGFQEVDYGNGAADVNPDDIESITVLKGAGAAALYGSRAASGVIVIKTKDGSNSQGSGISLNNSVTFESPLRYLNIKMFIVQVQVASSFTKMALERVPMTVA